MTVNGQQGSILLPCPRHITNSRIAAPALLAGGSEGLDPEAERGQRVSRDRVLEHGAKALHCRPSEPRLGHDEIIVLVLCRDEAEPVLLGDRLDRDPPIGSVLRDGDTHGVVRLRLRPVASRLCASEQAVRQSPLR